MIDELLKRIPLHTDMINEKHVRRIIGCLEWTLHKQIPGDVVELGCNRGNMAIYIQAMLTEKGSDKEFHVYDSFSGLPKPTTEDMSTNRTESQGDLAATVPELINFFMKNGVTIPRVHKGWFADQQYPDRISFAFFDGDFYQSIMDSWEKVYPQLSPGAIVTVHDYGFPPLVGVKKACDEFLKDKPHLQFWDDYVAIMLF